MDVYQPSGYGRRKRNVSGRDTKTLTLTTNHNSSAVEYSAPLSQHWKTIGIGHTGLRINSEESNDQELSGSSDFMTFEKSKLGLELSRKHSSPFPLPPEAVVRSFDNENVHKEDIGNIDSYILKTSPGTTTTTARTTTSRKTLISSKKINQINSKEGDDSSSTKFGDNIGFSVVMPAGNEIIITLPQKLCNII